MCVFGVVMCVYISASLCGCMRLNSGVLVCVDVCVLFGVLFCVLVPRFFGLCLCVCGRPSTQFAFVFVCVCVCL